MDKLSNVCQQYSFRPTKTITPVVLLYGCDCEIWTAGRCYNRTSGQNLGIRWYHLRLPYPQTRHGSVRSHPSTSRTSSRQCHLVSGCLSTLDLQVVRLTTDSTGDKDLRTRANRSWLGIVRRRCMRIIEKCQRSLSMNGATTSANCLIAVVFNCYRSSPSSSRNRFSNLSNKIENWIRIL